MTFEFLVACQTSPEIDIRQALTGLLTKTLADNQNSFFDDAITSMIRLHYERPYEAAVSSNLGGIQTLIAFAVEVPDDTESVREVIDDFVKSLPDTPPVFHALKFEDPLLQADLAVYAAEIFALEMKLRRVLSIIYLGAYQGEDPFDLIQDEMVQMTLPPRDRPQPEHMRAVGENQFFYLTFSQYADLNRRRRPDVATILDIIRSSEQYDSFRTEISRLPIGRPEDIDFIATLKELIGPVERMRNCVAHNRHPTESITASYPNARLRLETHLDEYLAHWELQ